MFNLHIYRLLLCTVCFVHTRQDECDCKCYTNDERLINTNSGPHYTAGLALKRPFIFVANHTDENSSVSNKLLFNNTKIEGIFVNTLQELLDVCHQNALYTLEIEVFM